ncbi:MAG: acyl-CoA/acyl-ACP dehydrogenase [Actinobacteria bacterium]|nr:acyl-CoA/acyl-ACP dehydrogenase [Actinomycetota bacterium]
MTRTRYGEALNEEQRAFAEAVDSFCLRECPPDKRRELTDDNQIAHNPELYAKLAATGWLGLTIPEEYGGAGGTLTDAAILTERLTYHRLPVGGYLTSVITAQGLIRFGTEEQKKTILPAVANGAILAIAITEPDTGSDAASITTSAKRTGEGWHINGQKIFTSNANHADWVLIVTRTDPDAAKHRGITLFVRPMASEGISYTRLETMGHIDTNITYYEDVPASDADIVGERNEGWWALVRGLNSERLIIAAEGLGLGQRAFDDAVLYAQQRHQFGHPIARFQALQHGFAETAAKLTATRLLTYHCAALLDSGDPAPAEASMAKLMATETAKEAALQGMQFMGGAGYMKEYDMESHLRDSLVMTIFGGTSQIQKNIIARQLGLTD